MDRRQFLKTLVALGAPLVIPSTKFIFDYGAHSYKRSARDAITDNNVLLNYLRDHAKIIHIGTPPGHSVFESIHYPGPTVVETEWTHTIITFPVMTYEGIIRSS